ncbi:MAG: DUF1330 domain-containing protein [Rhodospirillales bacterium]|jgi:uncharacterized protein (DUF1330 family)|nr:hypothetical protein [Rhodospirillaceae bacterium]MDP6428630.1 DUF1330 domain-containing protein [Rhodospirillales bacterium]MDP6645043.1 DUF1330 domain-containing protein [Rhodospirillales bacterium]MDP6842261.1 DUF1330 domain-containing protein [Rhodospirillales bacterium]|tara:strand:+ start:3190 stop:3498 length:309 start_codon:yes stop_codon:yes gene_type:complete
MPGYWVARSKINNPENYSKYTTALAPIFEKWKAKVLSRGGEYKILEGPEYFERFVIIEFPSMEDAIACHDSPEYQAAAAHRKDGSGEVELVILGATEGFGNN